MEMKTSSFGVKVAVYMAPWEHGCTGEPMAAQYFKRGTSEYVTLSRYDTSSRQGKEVRYGVILRNTL